MLARRFNLCKSVANHSVLLPVLASLLPAHFRHLLQVFKLEICADRIHCEFTDTTASTAYHNPKLIHCTATCSATCSSVPTGNHFTPVPTLQSPQVGEQPISWRSICILTTPPLCQSPVSPFQSEYSLLTCLHPAICYPCTQHLLHTYCMLRQHLPFAKL